VKTENELTSLEHGIPESMQSKPPFSRRMFVGTAAMAGAGLFGATAVAQTRKEQAAGRTAPSNTDPGPENKTLLGENPSSNNPPFTDHGNPGPIWYSFRRRRTWRA